MPGTIGAIATGGAIGALARYGANNLAVRLFGAAFPWGTLLVNVAGCLAMGVMAGLLAQAWQPGPQIKSFLATGVLGAFTTFSAFSLDAVILWQRGEQVNAALYVALSVLLSIGAVAAGLWLTRMGASGA